MSRFPFLPCIWMVRKMTVFLSSRVQNVSILVVLLYSWQINVNTRKSQILGDVYYGVQISYYAIIGCHLSIIVLSVTLFIGINAVSIVLGIDRNFSEFMTEKKTKGWAAIEGLFNYVVIKNSIVASNAINNYLAYFNETIFIGKSMRVEYHKRTWHTAVSEKIHNRQ